MNGKPLATFLSLCLCVLAVRSAVAHPVPNQNHDRYIVVRLTPTAVVVEYRLEVDEGRAGIDLPAAELAKVRSRKDLFPVFRDFFADVLAKNLYATLDGQPLDFRCVARKHEVTDHLRCDYRMEAAWHPTPDAPHAFTFRENNYELEDFNRLHVTLAANDQMTLATSVAPEDALLARRPEDFRPGDGERLRKVSATFRLAPIDPPGSYKPALPPDYADLKSEPEDAAAVDKPATPSVSAAADRPATPGVSAATDKPATPGGVSAPVLEPSREMPDRQPGDEPPGPDEGEGSWSLLHLLLDTNQGLGVLLLLAAAFGGVHALTPGHGKTLVAAYLVGERGTAWHALLLGIVTTVTHTAAVLVIATVLLFFPNTNPASIKLILEFGGGILVLSLGFWLLYTRLTGRADHVHLRGGHHHHHHHDHAHGHDHDHHHHAEVTNAAGKPSVWALLILGFKGGMVPCWDAIAMLAFAISAGRLWLGLPLLLAFSAGLAGVLTAIGVSVVHARNFAGSRFTGGERFRRFFRVLPLLSATAITVVGLWLCYDSLHPR